MTDEWIVHPNRSELGPNKPGRNGHYRPLRDTRARLPEETCHARIMLADNLAHVADEDGSVTFAGPNWSFVVGAARGLARRHVNDVPPPFGFLDGRLWTWWDGTQSPESILEGPEAGEHVRRYLNELFPHSTVELTDLR
ncbi:hypothetical protein KL864_31345 [Mycolicibacterium goodii]|uniref:hypothetical protein n=1 Tax=Mycolicibacterium goodii TaxID=134601 RepID=UPI001BDD7F53|nr:hypothetical protein [Mycolicibacterium goodii]MBU8820379.1 hypothetical protein [Mycolicibacterium goodii]